MIFHCILEFQPLVVIQLLMGIGLFIYASHQQHLAHVTFANFRKGEFFKKGKISHLIQIK